MVDAIFNGLLVGSTGFALASVVPQENPFIFTACAMGFCHGFLGLYGNIAEGISNSKEAEETTGSVVSKIHGLTRSCVEIITVPLINIDLYRSSPESSPLALGHGFFVVPLAFDLAFQVFDVEGDGSTTETLKELTILGNVVSLLFLGMNENQLPFCAMALAALCANYGAAMMDSMFQGSGENTRLLANSVYYALIPWALSEAGGSA